MAKEKKDKKEGGKDKDIISALNTILEHELAGVVRYMHYSFMVFGHNRIPIVKWLRDQCTESLDHASQAGEHITTLGGHPSLQISDLLETHSHSISDILQESLEHEKEQVGNFHKLLGLVEDKNVWLEEYARTMIQDEELHISEIEKMLRHPGKDK